ncbi:MAG: type II toxin-antitoxin system RelE/ParE family toxin [Verrucomicrobia bacterium]|nr:type II toxin-antitoxin system RelE/ParE family toxin [Verrucomicrobiota bacterium]
MQTVVETPEFVKDAKRAGLSQRERQAIIDFMAANPDAGAEMPGTGGARIVRFAAKGKGKSGGVRVITFYSGPEIPVFLLNVFAKNERTDLSASERAVLKKILGRLVEIYEGKN